MRQVRAFELPLRKDIYRKERLEEQRVWYANKSDWNKAAYRRVFIPTVGAQIGALIWAILMARDETLMFNLTGTLMGLAAALTAWGQVKQHQELAQAYAQAAFELQSSLSKWEQATSEEAFSSFVGDAENAVSREHTMWLARRDV